jgi:hypothetical protein
MERSRRKTGILASFASFSTGSQPVATAETSVAKEEAAKRGITLKIADGQQKQENQIKAVRVM